MAYFDQPLVDPTYDYDAQEQQLAQQAARIKALRATGASMPTPDNSEVGGWSLSTGQRMPGRVLKTPTSALLNPILANVGADIGEYRSNQARSDMNKAQDAQADTIFNSIKSRPAGEATYGAGEEGPTMTPGTPAYEPSNDDLLAASKKMSMLPKYREVGQKFMLNQLTEVPKEERKLAEARVLKQAELASKQRDRENALEVARIRSAQSGKLTMVQNDHGDVTGGYDGKSNQFVPLGKVPPGSMDTSAAPLHESVVPGAAATATAPAAAPGVGVAKKSPKVLADESALKTKIEETNDALGMIGQARPLLKNTSYGYADALKEGITGIAGQPQEGKAINAAALDTLSGQLASKYPRGPGSITDTERKLFVQYMGNVNNRLLDPVIRLQNLDKVEALLRESAKNAQSAQAGGGVNPPAAPAGATVRLTSDNDPAYTRLKSGDRFIDPEGNQRVKK